MVKSWGKLLLKIVSVLLFLAVSVLTLFFAYGYRFDPEKNDVQKVSIIDVQAKIKEAGLLLDGMKVSSELPYQIKNLIPGIYEVQVEKEGFTSWKRKVIVETDFVSIVNDVLLVPQDLSTFRKAEVTLSKGVDSFYGNDFMVEYLKGSKTLRVLTLSSKGNIADEVVEIARNDLTGLQIYDGKIVVLNFPGRLHALMDVRQKSFQFFTLPEGADNFRLSPDRRLLAFVKDGLLNVVPIMELQSTKKLLPVTLFQNVSAFDFAHDNSLIVLTNSFVYHYYPDQQVKEMIDMSPGYFQNVGITRGKNYSALILRDQTDQRWLYYYNGRKFEFLTKGVQGKPIINNFDQVAYVIQTGDIHYFDPYTEKKSAVPAEGGQYELLGWFDDLGHYYMKHEDHLILADIFGANKWTILQDLTADVSFVVNESFYRLQNSVLERTYFGKVE
ncbi:carboxypeptidase regulatory-like domain-containing protein [Candidatus Peregrinibacteria bacterium]|nr:carboxypeptidase regulatory-like domain-containing protein [Candidatus Peregrinibacteria bacterium]